MRYLPLILAFGFLYAQSPAKWWDSASQEQKDFAEKCYEFGKQYGRGHTLVAIAWMESSLGNYTSHRESSSGSFGISKRNRTAYEYRFRRSCGKNIDVVYTSEFEQDAYIALSIFEDNIRYFRRLGYSESEAWFWAYPRYNAGRNWWRFRRRGEVFNEKVKFLKEKFK